jgi:hypothetical protein
LPRSTSSSAAPSARRMSCRGRWRRCMSSTTRLGTMRS